MAIEANNYYKKQEKALFRDLEWNIPEQKQGEVVVLGGNAQNFSIVSRTVGMISTSFPVEKVTAVLPESLRGKIPSGTTGVKFLPATDGGSFRKSAELRDALSGADFSLIIGDLTRNAETATGVAEAVAATERPVIITRDAVDLLASEMANFFQKDLIIFGSMVQIQKLLRSVYYPKMLLLSMPILPAVEVLHKFTLSYPWTIVTLHQGMVLVADNGEVIGTSLGLTGATPLSIWDGKMATRILGMNLYNPGKRLEATSAGVIA